MSAELAVDLPADNFLLWPGNNTDAPRTATLSEFTILPGIRELGRLETHDIQDTKPVDKKFSNLNFEIGAAAADGLAGGMYSFDAFRAIDPAFLRAIEFSTADHVHGLTSVSEYIDQHFFDVGDAAAEGWLYRLQGYVGEQTVAAAFGAAGHVVEFPDTPNFPDIDMYVDGVPWQVKQGVDAASQVRDFAASHGSIEVATTPEAAAHFHDAHIHAFPSLDPDVVSDLTNHSIGGLHQGFHPHLHLPLLTIAVSSFREIRLLIEEKTSIQRALTYVAIDSAGVAGGGWAGAKVGA